MFKVVIKTVKGLLLCLLMSLPMMGRAQIGYQVSLLNNATGDVRANESVSVTVKITDSNGKAICEETKNETTNDFGVLSMTVGNSDTFANADWSQLPFFIEATVDNKLIGRSQILSVPIAEHAKHTGILTKELLCSKTWTCSWSDGDSHVISFKIDGTFEYKYLEDGEPWRDSKTGTYEIDGNWLTLFYYDTSDGGYQSDLYKYSESANSLGAAYGGHKFN